MTKIVGPSPKELVVLTKIVSLYFIFKRPNPISFRMDWYDVPKIISTMLNKLLYLSLKKKSL
jgi:hypothetical protein